MISHLFLETRTTFRRGDAPKSGPKLKMVAFMSIFIQWMKKLRSFNRHLHSKYYNLHGIPGPLFWARPRVHHARKSRGLGIF